MTGAAVPKVVFVVLAYNQGPWVRAACEAALAQTHGPLEILFSDDASTDDTFAVMSAVAAAYDGPHQVRLNRNPENLGLIRHVNRVQELADADLLVVAAGDDISLPERTARLVAAFREDAGSVFAYHSQVLTMDAEGRPLDTPIVPPLTALRPAPEAWLTATAMIVGATHAWTRPVFDVFGPLAHAGTFEDLVLAYRAVLLGGIRYLDEPLVRYRVGNGLSTRAESRQTRRANRRKRELRRQRFYVDLYRQRSADCQRVGRRDLAATLAPIIARHTLCLAVLEGECGYPALCRQAWQTRQPGALLKGLWIRLTWRLSRSGA